MVALGLAIKALLLGIVVVVLPIVLNNFFGELLQSVHTWAGSQIGDINGGPVIYQATGLTAYFADLLGLPEALSIVLGAVAVRFVIRFIPFVG